MPPSLNYQMFRNKLHEFSIVSWGEYLVSSPPWLGLSHELMSKPSSSYSQPENFSLLVPEAFILSDVWGKKTKREWRQLRVLEVKQINRLWCQWNNYDLPISYFRNDCMHESHITPWAQFSFSTKWRSRYLPDSMLGVIMYEMPGAQSGSSGNSSSLLQADGMLRPKRRFSLGVPCLKPLLFNTSISPTSLMI